MIKDQVTSYALTRADIYFPNGEIQCRYCPLFETYAREQCRLTGEYITNSKTFGYFCKLRKVEIDEHTGEVTENPINT